MLLLRDRHGHVDAERLEGLQRPQRRGELGPPARRARDDLHLCIIVSTPMKAEARVTAPRPTEQSMSATGSSTFARRFRRVAAGLAASLALGALSAHAAPTPFPADFRSSQ